MIKIRAVDQTIEYRVDDTLVATVSRGGLQRFQVSVTDRTDTWHFDTLRSALKHAEMEAEVAAENIAFHRRAPELFAA